MLSWPRAHAQMSAEHLRRRRGAKAVSGGERVAGRSLRRRAVAAAAAAASRRRRRAPVRVGLVKRDLRGVKVQQLADDLLLPVEGGGGEHRRVQPAILGCMSVDVTAAHQPVLNRADVARRHLPAHLGGQQHALARVDRRRRLLAVLRRAARRPVVARRRPARRPTLTVVHWRRHSRRRRPVIARRRPTRWRTTWHARREHAWRIHARRVHDELLLAAVAGWRPRWSVVAVVAAARWSLLVPVPVPVHLPDPRPLPTRRSRNFRPRSVSVSASETRRRAELAAGLVPKLAPR